MDQIETSTTSTSDYQKNLACGEFHSNHRVFSSRLTDNRLQPIPFRCAEKREGYLRWRPRFFCSVSLATNWHRYGESWWTILEGIVFYFRDFPYSHTACFVICRLCVAAWLWVQASTCVWWNLQRFMAVSYPFLYLRIASVEHIGNRSGHCQDHHCLHFAGSSPSLHLPFSALISEHVRKPGQFLTRSTTSVLCPTSAMASLIIIAVTDSCTSGNSNLNKCASSDQS